MKKIFKENNFDLIRLIASMQVLIHHSIMHLKVEHSNTFFTNVLSLFPGVPVFFFVSGFLISRSFENNSVLSEYTKNRLLRLYPALIVCSVISIICVYMTGYLTSMNVSFKEVVTLTLSQIILPQYHPDFMRKFGVGVLNGSLGTITIELQFYFLVPLLYWFFSFSKTKEKSKTLLTLTILFLVINVLHYSLRGDYGNYLLFKLWKASFTPWLYMFLVGVIFQKNFEKLYHLVHNRAIYVLPFYLISSYVLVYFFGWRMGNGINPVLFFMLAITIFSLAYSCPAFSKNILKGNDISYGLYIYHMPIVNLLIFYGYIHSSFYVVAVLVVTILIAVFSWVLIEKPSMKLKKHPLNILK